MTGDHNDVSMLTLNKFSTLRLLSSCKLSIKACFWAYVIAIVFRLIGLRVGVRAGLPCFAAFGGIGNSEIFAEVKEEFEVFCFLGLCGAMVLRRSSGALI